MTDHEIETVVGNVVDVSTPNTQSQFSHLTDRLNSSDASELIPSGMTPENLLGDSMRCRIQELGARIEDLIEDGFGLGNILDGFEMPDMSELGDKLKQLNPVNLLDKLDNLSLDNITKEAERLVDGAMDMITDAVDDAFDQMERAVKGLGEVFDEFGDRIEDLGGYMQQTIDGIASGLGDVLQDLTKPIEDIIDSLTKPCDKTGQNAEAKSQAILQNEMDMFDTNIDVVVGNVVSVNSIGHTTGVMSNTVKSALAETTSEIPVAIPADPAGAKGSDGSVANANENQQHADQKEQVTQSVADQVQSKAIDQARGTIDSNSREEVKKEQKSNQVAGETVNITGAFNSDDCPGILKRETTDYARIEWGVSGLLGAKLKGINDEPMPRDQSMDIVESIYELDNLLISQTNQGTTVMMYSRVPIRELVVTREMNDQTTFNNLWKRFLEPGEYGVITSKSLDIFKQVLIRAETYISDDYQSKVDRCDGVAIGGDEGLKWFDYKQSLKERRRHVGSLIRKVEAPVNMMLENPDTEQNQSHNHFVSFRGWDTQSKPEWPFLNMWHGSIVLQKIKEYGGGFRI